MTRTRPLALVVFAVAGAVAAVLLQVGLGAAGQSKLVPPVSLAVTLVLIAAVVLAAALPVRRALKAADASKGPIDPFYATRVLLIAKASAFTGALLAGAGLGFASELLARPVVASGALWSVGATFVAAVVLLVAGLVAEWFCLLPPDDEDRNSATPTSG